MKTVLLVLLLAAFCSGQTAPAPKTSGAPEPVAPHKLSPEALLLNVDRDFAQATAQRRLEGWMEYMADDAVLFSGKPVVGKEAIRTAMAPAFADRDFLLEWQPVRAEMFPSADTGYTVGRFQQHARNSKGEKVVRSGSYITVWKKQRDGSWKVVADGGAPDPPTPAPR